MKTEVNLVLCTVVLLTCGSHLETPVSDPYLGSASPVTGTPVPEPTVRPNGSAGGEDLSASDSPVWNNSAPSGGGPVSGVPVSNDSDSGGVSLPATDRPVSNNSAPGDAGLPGSAGPVSNDSDSGGAILPAPDSPIANESAPCGGGPCVSNSPIVNNNNSSSTSALNSTARYVTPTTTTTMDSSAHRPSSSTSTTLARGVHPVVGMLSTSTPPTNAASPSPTTPPPPSPGPSSQTQLTQDRPSQLNVKDGEEDPHRSELPLDPLLAGLVSVFILTAAVITLLLFLKFRRGNTQPEFRRLQDLPMDDMMEDAPLSMYSY